MITAWIRSIVGALVASSIVLSVPAAAQSPSDANEDQLQAQVKAALDKIRGDDPEAGQEELATLCFDNFEPGKSNLACFAFDAEFEGQTIAFGMLRVRCTMGGGKECASAAYLIEDLVEGGDPQQQLQLMRESCGNDYGLGCTLLGHALLLGTYGGYTDIEQSRLAKERACTLGELETCISLADNLEARLYGSTANYDFMDLALRMCPLPPERSGPDNCMRSVELVAVRGDEADWRQYARPFLSVGCDDYNDIEACAWLWEEYLTTDSGPIDQSKAAEYKAKVCRREPATEGC